MTIRKPGDTEEIYCCSCAGLVDAVCITGADVYPHRKALHKKLFWQCPFDDLYVGTHGATGEPLGSIPTSSIRRLRQDVHRVLDPLWKTGTWDRSAIYREMSKRLGFHDFHTAQLNNELDCRLAFRAARQLQKEALDVDENP